MQTSIYYKLSIFYKILTIIMISIYFVIIHTDLCAISKKLDDLEPSQLTIIQEVPVEPQEETFEPVAIQDLYVDEIPYLAKTVYGEARGCSKTQQAAVVWCILNRVDSEKYPNNIVDVVTQKWQFAGYSEGHPVEKEIEELVVDVLTRWNNEKNGEANSGRILPKEYLYFYGDGKINHFTTVSGGTDEWDWSWGSVY